MKSKTLFYLLVLTLFTSLIPAVHAQTYTRLYSFAGHTDGKQPKTGVIVKGNVLYGTTAAPCGTVYQLANTGSNWLFSPVAALPNNCSPRARVVFGPDGHLYGTSEAGGQSGGGTVFKLTPPLGPCKTVACYWNVNDLHDFNPDTEGYDPGSGDLIWDQQGNIYGTTEYSASGGGTVWELTPSGNGWTENILYTFSSSDGLDGALPVGGLVLDSKGNLFGTTIQGGSNNLGVIFELTNIPGVGWTEQVLYNFQGAGDGANPFVGLTLDSGGNIYGTTAGPSNGGGTVFELSPSGNSWVFTILYSLPAGDHPYGGVVFGPDGGLYGTFITSGFQGGSVFKLTNTQNGWQYSSLHDFGVYEYPECTVTFDAQGNLYGTTAGGGAYGDGTVWMVTP